MIKNTRRELRDIESLVHRKTYDLWKKFWSGHEDFKLLCDHLGVEITTTPEKRAVTKKEI